MAYNFADLKKEAAATAENIYSEAADKAKQNTFDLLSGGAGQQDDNAHTEQFFSNDKKDLDFEHVDPQAFVQRMSAGAKEAQEELDAKFAQPLKEEMDGIIAVAMKTANQRQQDVKNTLNDFMNAERDFFGDLPKPLSDKPLPIQTKTTITTLVGEDPIIAHTTRIEDDHTLLTLDPKANEFKPSAPLQGIQQHDLPQFQPQIPQHLQSEPQYQFDIPSQNLQHQIDSQLLKNLPEDDFSGITTTVLSKMNKDSDNESPSISFTPSPAKKMTDGTLKEQDNDKFISSEDLLVDIKDEHSSVASEKSSSTEPSSKYAGITTLGGASFKNIPTTDLDDDDNHTFDMSEGVTSKPLTETNKEQIPSTFTSNIETFNDVLIPTKDEQPKPSTSKSVTKPSEQLYDPYDQQPKLLSVEQLFYKYGLDAWFKPERLHPQVESLIYWRDVKKSGIVFGAGVTTILAISCFSVISVFAWLSLILLVAALAFKCYKNIMQALQKTSDGHPFEEYLKFDLTISQEKVQNVAGVAVAHINGFTAELRRLFLVEDFGDSMKFGVLLYVLTYIGAWLNGMTLVLLAFISLFTLPKLYENNKESIDTYLDLVLSKITELTDKVKDVLPMGNKKPVVAESDKDK